MKVSDFGWYSKRRWVEWGVINDKGVATANKRTNGYEKSGEKWRKENKKLYDTIINFVWW